MGKNIKRPVPQHRFLLFFLRKLSRKGNESIFFFCFLSDADRSGRYAVTRESDVNSIFEGMDMTIFDKRSSQRWRI